MTEYRHHVAFSELSREILAGKVAKGANTWLNGETNVVTPQAIVAVAQYALAVSSHGLIRLTKDGRPAYTIIVKAYDGDQEESPEDVAEIERQLREAMFADADDDNP
jgi:hypothetical protein